MIRPRICLQKIVKVGWVEEWKPTLKLLHTDEVKNQVSETQQRNCWVSSTTFMSFANVFVFRKDFTSFASNYVFRKDFMSFARILRLSRLSQAFCMYR